MCAKELYYQAIEHMEVGEVETHYSDLYLKVTEVSKELVSNYQFKENVTTFVSQIDNKLWYDVAFAYSPFWNNQYTNPEIISKGNKL